MSDFKVILETSQQIHLKSNEPIPLMSKYNEGKVESCLKTPFQTVFGVSAYKTFYDKAAILLYLFLKNHPLQNGNKRMAIATLSYFCFINGKTLSVDNSKLYTLIIGVTNNSDKKDSLENIKTFLIKYIK